MDKSIGSKILHSKKSFKFKTALGTVITAHKMKSDGSRKFSAILTDGTEVNSPIMTFRNDHVDTIKAKSTEDVSLATEISAVLSKKMKANLLKK